MKTLFDLAPAPIIPVIDDNEFGFPVAHIYCIGRNYAAHAKEMGHSGREAPFYFLKPVEALVINPTQLNYPDNTQELHHEVELVVAIGKNGRNISLSEAWDFVFGYALGIDLTKRDLQSEAKAKGRPWEQAKGFEQSAPVSSIIPKNIFGEFNNGSIQLSLDHQTKQQGDLQDLIWSIPEIIVELSKRVELKAGDLIFTGTPSGVGEIKRGQHLAASFEDKLFLEFSVI